MSAGSLDHERDRLAREIALGFTQLRFDVFQAVYYEVSQLGVMIDRPDGKPVVKRQTILNPVTHQPGPRRFLKRYFGAGRELTATYRALDGHTINNHECYRNNMLLDLNASPVRNPFAATVGHTTAIVGYDPPTVTSLTRKVGPGGITQPLTTSRWDFADPTQPTSPGQVWYQSNVAAIGGTSELEHCNRPGRGTLGATRAMAALVPPQPGRIRWRRNEASEAFSMWRNSVLAAGLLACLLASGTGAREDRTTVVVEVYVPESARLLIEGQDTRSTGPMRRFVSPPLAPGDYIYTITAIIPGPNGPRTVTRRIDVRPGDFESIDLREPGKRPIADVEYEPTPQPVVDALLRLAKVTRKDVLWDLGCGDGRIPVTAAREYACKACGFDIDPERVKDSLANVRKHGVERLVTIEQRDIFALDLSKGPTIVTLYLLPRLNARLLPQLRNLPPGARVISIAHRMADIKPDEHIVVDTELGEFDVYLWKAETLRSH